MPLHYDISALTPTLLKTFQQCPCHSSPEKATYYLGLKQWQEHRAKTVSRSVPRQGKRLVLWLMTEPVDKTDISGMS